MSILRELPVAPAWFYRRDYGRVRLLECGCGFTYVAMATKTPPERCLACHHAGMVGYRWGTKPKAVAA